MGEVISRKPMQGKVAVVTGASRGAGAATDPHVMTKSGQVLTVGDLAREYGYTDADGRQPEGFRFSAG